MVTSATNFSRTGLSDWLVQRVSAIVLLAYSLFIFGVFVLYPELSFEQWSGIFSNNAVRLFSMMSVLALCGHAWIGMWTIATDYLTSLQLGECCDVCSPDLSTRLCIIDNGLPPLGYSDFLGKLDERITNDFI